MGNPQDTHLVVKSSFQSENEDKNIRIIVCIKDLKPLSVFTNPSDWKLGKITAYDFGLKFTQKAKKG